MPQNIARKPHKFWFSGVAHGHGLHFTKSQNTEEGGKFFLRALCAYLKEEQRNFAFLWILEILHPIYLGIRQTAIHYPIKLIGSNILKLKKRFCVKSLNFLVFRLRKKFFAQLAWNLLLNKCKELTCMLFANPAR